MIVVGTVATVAAAAIAFYALINPADLNQRLTEVATRLAAEPQLELSDRFAIVEAYCPYDHRCSVSIGKYDTNETGLFIFEACSPDGASIATPKTTGFGKAQALFLHDFPRQFGETDLHLRIETPSGSQTVIYRLDEDTSGPMPILRASTAPSVTSALTSCTS